MTTRTMEESDDEAHDERNDRVLHLEPNPQRDAR